MPFRIARLMLSAGMFAALPAATAVRSRPANLLDLWQRPWVIKSVAKALLSIALPATAMQGLSRRISMMAVVRSRIDRGSTGRGA